MVMIEKPLKYSCKSNYCLLHLYVRGLPAEIHKERNDSGRKGQKLFPFY